MKLSIELTLYPLQDNYLEIIKACIKKLNQYSELKVQTSPTATILHGEYEHTMAVLKDVVSWSYKNYGRCVFVAKLIPDHKLDQ